MMSSYRYWTVIYFSHLILWAKSSTTISPHNNVIEEITTEPMELVTSVAAELYASTSPLPEGVEEPNIFFPNTLAAAKSNSTHGHVGENIFSRRKHPFISSGYKNLPTADACLQEAQCEDLETTSCFGVPLPYKQTSLALAGFPNQRAAKVALELWRALKNVPRCWSVVQPFLCAMMLPQCFNSSVQLPSKEMCLITRGPCKIVELERGWPDYLKCRDEFPAYCQTVSRDLLFNTSGQCSPPLVATSRETLWYEGFKGCGIQCANPLFTKEEHDELRFIIAMAGGICLVFSALTVLTYLIDWRYSFKYPASIIHHISLCYFMASVGFLIQFYEDARRSITCHSDGTLRQSELSGGCWLVFICVYYFIFAGGIWFIIWSYSLNKSFKSQVPKYCQSEPTKWYKSKHFLSWGPHIFLIVVIYLVSRVEADSVYGLCVLSSDLLWRILAFILPASLCVFLGCSYLISGLITLIKMKLFCSNVIKEHANKKIIITIIRLSVTIISVFMCYAITVYCHIYIYLNQDHWLESLRSHILCTSEITKKSPYDDMECALTHRPNILIYKLHLLTFFGSGIIMSSWCWTVNSLHAWKRFLKRVADLKEGEPMHIKKHKIIADAFAKRNNFHHPGRLSLSLRSFHSDPVGLNFDINSATSGGLSSSWAAAVPRLMCRREAIFGSTALLSRRNSIDSVYSFRSRISIESTSNDLRMLRRRSLDSQMSLRVSEVERRVSRRGFDRFGGTRRKRNWLSLKKGRRGSIFDRRASYTSEDSNTGSMVVPSFPLNTHDSLYTTMMKLFNMSNDASSSQQRKDDHAITIDTDEEEAPSGDGVGGLQRPPFRRRSSTLDSLFKYRSKKLRRERNVIKASVGIQTSLESIDLPVDTAEKACQVSTPLLSRSEKGSLTDSVSERLNGSVGETSFVLNEALRRNRQSPVPLNISLNKNKTNDCHVSNIGHSAFNMELLTSSEG